jgi:hypothetical protein
VRCPIDVISSFLSHRANSWGFIAQRCPTPALRATLTGLMAKVNAAIRRRREKNPGGAPVLPTSGSLRHEEMSDLVSFAVNAWLCWNGHVERYAFGRVALERLDVRELCLLGGFAAQRCPNESTPVSVGALRALEEELQTARTIRRALSLDAGNAANHREHPQLAFENISRTVGPTVSGHLLNMSRRYGYDLVQDEEKCRLLPDGEY